MSSHPFRAKVHNSDAIADGREEFSEVGGHVLRVYRLGLADK